MAPRRNPAVVVLRELSGEQVAAEALEGLVKHVGQLAFALAPRLAVIVPSAPMPEMVNGTQLGLTLQALTEYAKRGAPVWDWQTDREAEDAYLEVHRALFTRAWDDGDQDALVADGDMMPTDGVRAVMLAARARIAVAQGGGVRAVELAVLSGLSLRQVYRDLAFGKRGGAASVKATVAKKWLTERGVPGFVKG